MNKEVMISIKPEHAVNILNGIKTLELRTWIPKDYVGWVNVYVAKRKPYLYKNDTWLQSSVRCYLDDIKDTSDDIQYLTNGKVAFRFWYDGYDRVKRSKNAYGDFINDVDFYEQGVGWVLPKDEEMYRQKLCLTKQEIIDYIKNKECFAWRINKLEIFDKPKELSDFLQFYGGEESFYELKRAPQKMVWVYPKEKENE